MRRTHRLQPYLFQASFCSCSASLSPPSQGLKARPFFNCSAYTRVCEATPFHRQVPPSSLCLFWAGPGTYGRDPGCPTGLTPCR